MESRTALLLCSLLLTACDQAPPMTVPEGRWGGLDLELHIDARGVAMARCGRPPGHPFGGPLALDTGGRFSAVRRDEDGTLTVHGKLTGGKTMVVSFVRAPHGNDPYMLHAATEGDDFEVTFHLEHGREGRFVRKNGIGTCVSPIIPVFAG